MFKSWMRLTRDAVLLGVEAQRVMGLRFMKLSRGGRAAEAEAVRMVTEKTNALTEAGIALAHGGSATALSNACEGEQATLVEILITGKTAVASWTKVQAQAHDALECPVCYRRHGTNDGIGTGSQPGCAISRRQTPKPVFDPPVAKE